MKHVEYRTYDRSQWPSGPWDGEPDKVQWPDPITGLPCLAVRNHQGAWCGYVGVPPGHSLHGKPYNKVDVEVHGGLTFSDACNPAETPERGICHVPDEGEADDVWWFGFDCNHAWDDSPNSYSRRLEIHEHRVVYRDLAYVQENVAKLAEQLNA